MPRQGEARDVTVWPETYSGDPRNRPKRGPGRRGRWRRHSPAACSADGNGWAHKHMGSPPYFVETALT